MDATEWKAKKRTIELTNDQWNTLECYILMTTNHRKDEKEAWQKLATETDENGQLLFKNAASNAEFYEELEEKLNDILTILGGPYA